MKLRKFVVRTSVWKATLSTTITAYPVYQLAQETQHIHSLSQASKHWPITARQRVEGSRRSLWRQIVQAVARCHCNTNIVRRLEAKFKQQLIGLRLSFAAKLQTANRKPCWKLHVLIHNVLVMLWNTFVCYLYARRSYCTPNQSRNIFYSSSASLVFTRTHTKTYLFFNSFSQTYHIPMGAGADRLQVPLSACWAIASTKRLIRTVRVGIKRRD